MKKIKKLIIKLIVIVLVLIVLGGVACYFIYDKYTSPVNPTSDDKITFEITGNDRYANLGTKLMENNLIKSELFYKIYIKLNSPNNLQQGVYYLSPSMSLKEIIAVLDGGNGENPYITSITIKEGYNIRKIAKVIEENTDNTYDDVMNKLKDNSYISSLVAKYWFLTDEVLNNKIYYPLEGYLFPDTYQISSKYSVEEVFKVLLDQTNNVLLKYKDQINKSDLSIHEIMTLASIVELEAGNANDRKGVAGVFYNRLQAYSGYTLGSDVTTYYALKIDDFKHSLTKSELNTCDNGYNTRCSTLSGLPVGPISNPGEESITAAVNPTKHNYYYFVADKSGKTYLSKDLEEHNATIAKLQAQGNWQA